MIKKQYDILKNNSFVIHYKTRKKLDKNYQVFKQQEEYIFSHENSSKILHEFPWICYDSKIKDKHSRVLYKECERSYKKCNDIGKLHFGKYPNDFKAHEAFVRCIKNKPKFIDTQGL